MRAPIPVAKSSAAIPWKTPSTKTTPITVKPWLVDVPLDHLK